MESILQMNPLAISRQYPLHSSLLRQIAVHLLVIDRDSWVVGHKILYEKSKPSNSILLPVPFLWVSFFGMGAAFADEVISL